MDVSGNVYFADTSKNWIRVVINATGILTTTAGDGTKLPAEVTDDFYFYDNGPALSARFNQPLGIAADV